MKHTNLNTKLTPHLFEDTLAASDSVLNRANTGLTTWCQKFGRFTIEMKILAVLITSLFSYLGGVSNASVIYFQDFSASGANIDGVAVTEGVLQNVDNVTVVGGDATNQATNGDFTYQLISGNGAADGDGFILNAPSTFTVDGSNQVPGAGLANIDEPATFTTGTITTADGASGSLTISLASFNVGGEFVSINSVLVHSDATTGALRLDLNLNGFGDLLIDSGNENIGIMTNFSGGNTDFEPIMNVNIAELEEDPIFTDQITITDNDQGFGDTTFSFVIRAVPEPSSLLLLGVILSLVGIGHRKRRSLG